ncbi:MAG: MMPL family transporter, partial [Solirubrobacterales bacterium]|nr:MMPL family transporter [Solirubrobacterales bacterium]
MSLFLYRLAHASIRHRRLVVAGWLALLATLVALVATVGAQTSDDLTLPGTGSTEATDLLDRYLPEQANGTNPLALEVENGKLTAGAYRKGVEDTVDAYRREPGVEKVVSPLSGKGSEQLTKDERIGYISLTLRAGPDTLTEGRAEELIAIAAPAEEAGIATSAGGYLGQQASTPSTHSSEVVGIVAAMIVLAFTFGTAVAMAMPITTAILGVIIGLSVIALAGHAIEIPTVAPTLGTMIGLGVGIDYALFIVTRYRRGLHEGMEPDEAVARSCATSGSAVAFAGGTVVIALLSLKFADIPIVSALGYSAAIVVVIAVCCALTLLPTLLAMLGHRIESLPIGKLHKPEERNHKSEFFERMARFVGRHPWSSAVVAVLVLVGIGWPALDMRLGQQDYGQFPTSTTARQAYDTLTKGFGPGINGPFLIAVRFEPPAHNDQKQLDQLEQQQKQQQQQATAQANEIAQQLVAEGVPPDQAQQQAEAEVQPSEKQQQQYDQQKQYLQSSASDPDLVHLEKQIGKADGVKSVSQAKVSGNGKAAVFSAIPTTGPSAEATSGLVTRLRDDVIPPATKGTGLTPYVGGSTAAYVDLADVIGDKLPQVIITVVALSFVLLLVAFRSIVVPLTSAAMNMLSVAAAYGVLTAVFEKGWGVELIGLDHSIPIVSFVPLLMFAILFGLSMDYQVFLVSRIGERYVENDGDNHEAVVNGLATSARVITSAALIMVCVFSSFVLNGNPTVKQFGIGMAAAIAIDATIVRCLLVPSVMMLLGRSNWWLPGWMDRVIPRVGLETEDALPPLGPDGRP